MEVVHMAASIIGGPHTWEGSRDADGHREYTVEYLVQSDYDDGPAAVMNATGLPMIGSFWHFMRDVDIWAWCRPDMKVKYNGQKDGEPFRQWVVQQTFSTKPGQRCQDKSIEDPLAEPPKLSGSFVRYTEETSYDKDGRPLTFSNHEWLHGPQAEFDAGRATVRVEQNVVSLGIGTVAQMFNTVNGSMMWGVAKRCVKLSEFTWERKLRGTCNFYFTRAFGFDIQFDTFDHWVADQGSMVLRGKWESQSNSNKKVWKTDADVKYTNPADFIRFTDVNEQPVITLLDGHGHPLQNTKNLTIYRIQKYRESNFFNLGIPTQLG